MICKQYLINGDFGVSGIFRAKLVKVDGESDIRAYVPGIHNSVKINKNGDVINPKILPIVQWCCYNIESQDLSRQEGPAFVMFENGDMKRPVVLSYTIIGGTSNSQITGSSNSSGNSDKSPAPSSDTSQIPPPPADDKQPVIVNWWKNTSVTYQTQGGSSGTITIVNECYTYMSMSRSFAHTTWISRQHKLQQKYINEYSNANGIVFIDGMPVVATVDYWGLGNNYVGRVINVEYENGNKKSMIIGDVKGTWGPDKTVVNLGHVHTDKKTGKNEISIIETGYYTVQPTRDQIIAALGSGGSHTKSITLTTRDMLAE